VKDRGGQFTSRHLAIGELMGAISDLQVQRVQELVTDAGQAFTYQSFPQMPHSMHGYDPELYAKTVIQWASTLA
jgi:hypothetical protein